MTPTRRPSEQERFGAAAPGKAQAENPELDPEMIDEDAPQEGTFPAGGTDAPPEADLDDEAPEEGDEGS